MENNTKILLLLVSLFIPLISQARIGETFEQCTNRYGQVREIKWLSKNIPGQQYVFIKEPFFIVIYLDKNGKAGKIDYYRPIISDAQPFNKYEIGKLMEANTGPRTIKAWKRVEEKEDFWHAKIKDVCFAAFLLQIDHEEVGKFQVLTIQWEGFSPLLDPSEEKTLKNKTKKLEGF